MKNVPQQEEDTFNQKSIIFKTILPFLKCYIYDKGAWQAGKCKGSAPETLEILDALLQSRHRI